MKDTFQQFYEKWVNKPCEVSDPSNLNQCFDLAYAWCDALGVTRDAIRHLYASEIYTKPNDLTIKYFELVPNTALAVPQIGDIAVFKGGMAGHVSIANGVGDTNNFQSFDQNFGSTVGKCGIITHPYDNVLGFLRLRKPCPPIEITDKTRIPQIDNQEVQAIKSALVAKDANIASLKGDLLVANVNKTTAETELATCKTNLEKATQNPPSEATVEPKFTSRLGKLFYGLAKYWEAKSQV